MHLRMISQFLKLITTLTLAVLFVIPVKVVLAAPAVNSGVDYDIPISELKKVKKKETAKKVSHESKKSKKSVGNTEVPSVKTTGQTKIPPVVPNGTTQVEEAQKKNTGAPEPIFDSVNTQVHHSPYSFVVTGKRTVIHAVINSKTDIQEVKCIIGTTGNTEKPTIKMTPVSGTRFTYTATLPSLTSESPSLRYSIVAIDSLGKETRSNEFVTPVTSSPVLPSWQLENSGEAVPSVEEKDAKKPQETVPDATVPK